MFKQILEACKHYLNDTWATSQVACRNTWTCTQHYLGYIGQAIIGVKVPNSSHVASIQHWRVRNLSNIFAHQRTLSMRFYIFKKHVLFNLRGLWDRKSLGHTGKQDMISSPRSPVDPTNVLTRLPHPWNHRALGFWKKETSISKCIQTPQKE